MSDQMNELLRQLSKKLSLTPEQVQNAAARGDVDALLQNADGDSARLRALLSDPEKQRELLGSPQAQALIKLLNKK